VKFLCKVRVFRAWLNTSVRCWGVKNDIRVVGAIPFQLSLEKRTDIMFIE
jgi:hypothetical protein